MRLNKLGAFLLAAALISISDRTAHASESESDRKAKILDIGIVLRLSDRMDDTIANLDTGMETAKAIFEKNHPETRVRFHRYSHTEGLASVVNASLRVVADAIPAVMGGELSEESQVIRDLVSKKNIVFITPTSSNPQITEGYPFTFRACFSDRFVSSQLAQFTLNKLNPKVLGVLHNVSSIYTDFMSKQFIRSLQEDLSQRQSSLSVPILDEKVGEDTMSYSDQIKTFQSQNVTHVALFTHRADAIRFILQASEKGFFPVYLGTDSWGSNEFVHENFVKKSPYGSRFTAYRTVFWKEDTQSPWVNRFRRYYQAKYHVLPNAWVAMGFDTAWILMTAMNQVVDPKDSRQIQKELEKIRHLELVSNPDFSFGPDHSPHQNLHIYRLDKGSTHYEATLK